jgi:ABC-type oligopeptide transport system ATPase subunit
LQEVKKDLSEIDVELEASESIGTIGSPSSTNEINIDISFSVIKKKLVGELAILKFTQDNQPHYSIGQVTEIELRNVWLEDPTIRSVARQKGRVNPISEKQDTHIGKVISSAIFSERSGSFSSSVMGTVPSTGTYIHIATDNILDILLRKYRNMLFYLGYVYRSNTKLPLWFRHFGKGSDGAGEAYHLGIFGSTGSGKSTLAKMIVAAYARYSQMSVLIIDPVGEFSKSIDKDQKRSSVMGFDMDLAAICNFYQKPIKSYRIRDIVLDTWELFSILLHESDFFTRLSVNTRDKKEIAIGLIQEFAENHGIPLARLNEEDVFNRIWEYLGDEETFATLVYNTPAPRQRYMNLYNQSDSHHFFVQHWSPIAQLFQRQDNNVTVNTLINRSFSSDIDREIVIIDLSEESARTTISIWNDRIQALVIKRILDAIIWIGDRAWQNNQFFNALVILDEAHRFVTNTKFDSREKEALRLRLLDATRTTRKYGLGWMFLSTSLSSIHRDILQQLRIIFFGFGLSLGNDFMMMRELVGDPNALKLYQTFNDPASAFDEDSKQYSFMTRGPVSPLSFAGTPLFLSAFNTPDKFYKSNKIILHKGIEEDNDQYGL